MLNLGLVYWQGSVRCSAAALTAALTVSLRAAEEAGKSLAIHTAAAKRKA